MRDLSRLRQARARRFRPRVAPAGGTTRGTVTRLALAGSGVVVCSAVAATAFGHQPPRARPAVHRAAARALPTQVDYAGVTAQGRRLDLVIDRPRDAVVAARFSIAYRCPAHRSLTLRVLILRPHDSWALVNRLPPAAGRPLIGFSDWFSGPAGHDFHITGTLSSDRSRVTGTLHSRLADAGGFERCDSGHLGYHAVLGATRLALPATRSITLAQFRHLPSGITTAETARRFGAPDDHDSFRPAGVVANSLPTGVPGAGQTWMDYAWRGHPRRFFQFFFRAGRLIPGSPGRSIAWS